MRVDLGVKVLTSDDHEVGSVKHLILDPSTTELRSIVVEHGFINRESKVVSASLIATVMDERAHIGCTNDEFERLPDFIETDYTAPPPGYTLPVSYPGGGLLWPVGYPVPSVPEVSVPPGERDEQAERLRERNLENAVIDTDTDVMSRDGEKLGEVEQLEIDSISGKPSRLVIRKGFFFPESLELPVSTIASVDDGVVTLNLDKDQALEFATHPNER